MQQKLLDVRRLSAGFGDPAFSRNRDLPLHRWVPWIAGFSAEFVEDCLARYLPVGRSGPTPCVLDPFAGVGTTLVQSFIRGLEVVGFEINPYAALAASAKLNAVMVSPGAFQRTIAAFERFMESIPQIRAHPRTVPPTGFSGRTQLFSPKVERKVLFALDFISALEEEEIRDLFRLALGSVMVSFSNYSYEPSLTRRAAVGKPDIEDAGVAEVVSAKLRLMLDDIGWLRTQVKDWNEAPASKVYAASVFAARDYLRKNSVDLVVTSPPYLNNYHYPRNTRPQLHWLGFTSGRGYNGAREIESFGKFWQTVRDLPPVAISFKLRELGHSIETIRGLNTDKGPYGGPGWANYVATYFNDAYRFCLVLAQALRPGGAAVIVLGNSIIQGIEVKTDQYFGRIAELCGLKLEQTLLLREKRTGNSIIRSSVRVDKAKQKTMLYESAIVLRR
jgi:DNA modification methylase